MPRQVDEMARRARRVQNLDLKKYENVYRQCQKGRHQQNAFFDGPLRI